MEIVSEMTVLNLFPNTEISDTPRTFLLRNYINEVQIHALTYLLDFVKLHKKSHYINLSPTSFKELHNLVIYLPPAQTLQHGFPQA